MQTDLKNRPRLETSAPRRGWRVVAPGGATAFVSTADRGEVTIGSAEDVDLRVDCNDVAPHHVRLRAAGVGLLVEDLSTCGATRLGGEGLTQQVLTDEAVLTLGPNGLKIRITPTVHSLRGPKVPGLVGESAAMVKLRRDIGRFAQLGRPVLIQGESGSGKDVVARGLHELSGRQGAFVSLNVGGLSEALADSELFGHHKGAFTGAVSSRPGAFREAHGGTLFLDEIADLGPPVQVKLLRCIEDGLVRSLGSDRTERVQCRVVSACWADLAQRCEQKRFREDLYHRISTVIIRVPPLRRRLDDVPPLAVHFLSLYRLELGEHVLSDEAVWELQQYSWPGNVRELGTVLYRAAARSESRILRGADVRTALPRPRPPRKCPAPSDLARLLEEHGGNVSAAARAAGIPRSTFRARLRKTGATSAELRASG